MIKTQNQDAVDLINFYNFHKNYIQGCKKKEFF